MEAPQVFHKKQSNAYSTSPFASDDPPAGDHFSVEELFDFSNDDDDDDAGVGFFHSADSSAVTVVESCNSSSFSGCEPVSFLEDSDLPDAQFSDQLCIPEDDLAELEWLSNLVEEPFSSEDIQKLELITGVKVKPDEPSQIRQPATTHAAAIFKPEIVSVPAKARSKRSRAAPSNWNNSLLLSPSPATSSSEPEIPAGPPPPPLKIRATPKVAAAKKRDSSEAGLSAAVEGRRCMHCSTDKTPQWRTGPMGPKTLCNACGVRYKSGRLVPEYRPAASPTFVLTKHSNSHRKVLELRRQKEMVRSQQPPHQPLILDHHHHHQDMIFDSSNGDDYLIQQSMAHDYRQLL